MDELIKAAPEIVKSVGPMVAAIPFTGVVKRMLGPAADEVAEMWKDQIRLYRYGRQLKCIEKAEKMAKDAGIAPNPVPPKILFPLLEGASMEDDEALHDMWAALLANGSLMAGRLVRPSFIKLLQDMAPDETMLLQEIHHRWQRVNAEPTFSNRVKEIKNDERYRSLFTVGVMGSDARNVWWQNNDKLYDEYRQREAALVGEYGIRFPPLDGEEEGETKARFRACLQVLEDAGLISEVPLGPYITVGGVDPIRVLSDGGAPLWQLSDRGMAFLIACSPPKA